MKNKRSRQLPFLSIFRFCSTDFLKTMYKQPENLFYRQFTIFLKAAQKKGFLSLRKRRKARLKVYDGKMQGCAMTSEKTRRTPLCMGAQAYLFFRAAPRRKKHFNVLRAGCLSFQEEFPFGGTPPLRRPVRSRKSRRVQRPSGGDPAALCPVRQMALAKILTIILTKDRKNRRITVPNERCLFPVRHV